MFFLKIRFFFRELFVYKIPALWQKIKESFEDDPWKAIGLIMLVVALTLGVYEGVQYSKVMMAQQEQKELKAKMDKSNQLMDIKTSGPEKYLEEQLGVNNKAQVIKMFNNSAKWQDRYDEVITHCANFSKNSQYRNYLNPIVKDILNGQLVSQENVGFSFAKKQVDPFGDDATNGVMMILISSKDKEQVKKVKALIDSHPSYKVVVFDKKSPNGENNYNNCMLAFLEAQSGIKDGYNSENAWTGIAYAFNDNRPVFHTKSLNDLPKELPTKSLSGKKDID